MSASLWYNTGTVTVTAGSTTLTGSGTAWVGAVRAGYGVQLPDGKIYLVAAVISNTSLTISPAYAGGNASAQPYIVFPTRGLTAELLAAFNDTKADFDTYINGPLSGMFPGGSASAPSVSFAADPDTGLHNPAPNQAALAAGGVNRIVATTAGATVTGLLTGSAVTQSATDMTAGRLLKIGDFGQGIKLPTFSGNVDSFTLAPGLYFAGAAATGTKPLGPSSYGHLVIRHATSGERIHQIWTREVASTFRRWERYAFNGAWSAWSEVYHAGATVGTVSQTGGVPTGALIEKGANANGRYRRFACGLQICLRNYTSSDAADTTWTFPAGFIAEPEVSVIAVAPGARAYNLASLTSTTVAIGVWSANGASRVANSTRVMAIGEWF